MLQRENLMIGGAMTDVKGDRGLSPSQQEDPDVFVHVTKRDSKGVYITGAKAHQTGCINSHWIIAMPTMRLKSEDKDYALLAHSRRCSRYHIYLWQTVLWYEEYGGRQHWRRQCHVFRPGSHDNLQGCFHSKPPYIHEWRIWICLNVGRALYLLSSPKLCVQDRSWGHSWLEPCVAIADYNGVANASHIKDKLVEMTHLNETIFAAGIASSYRAHKTSAGNWQNDDMLANVCKHNVTRFPYEIGRLAQDIAGGLVVTMPSEKEFRNPETGPLLEKYLKGRKGVSTENRMRVLRLIENMTLGRNAVGYLTESMHGAGSPQAQRIQIARQMHWNQEKLAKRLAMVKEGELQKWCQSLQNTLIEYLTWRRINPDKSIITIEPTMSYLSLTIFQPLLFPLFFKEFDLKKDYLSVQHNYYGITPGLCWLKLNELRLRISLAEFFAL